MFYLFISVFPAEYDRHLASPNGMATGYPDPNVNNHGLSQGVKPRFSGGMERPPGALERVLKVFHYFENSSEPSTWASNIRHGDSTDIKVCMLVGLMENNSYYNNTVIRLKQVFRQKMFCTFHFMSVIL